MTTQKISRGTVHVAGAGITITRQVGNFLARDASAMAQALVADAEASAADVNVLLEASGTGARVAFEGADDVLVVGTPHSTCLKLEGGLVLPEQDRAKAKAASLELLYGSAAVFETIHKIFKLNGFRIGR